MMRLIQIDLSEYLNTRRKMRLLPNLLDFGMAYSVFRPMVRVDAVLRPLAQLKGVPPESVIIDIVNVITAEPLVFGSAVVAYSLFALLIAIFSVAFTSKLKSLVLSDSQWTVISVGAIFLMYGTALFIASASITGVGLASLVAALPGAYVYAAFAYFRQLKSLKKHPVYHCLVGVKRRSFTFATTRYAFFSFKSLMVYGTILLASWKVYLAYVGVVILILSLYIVSHSPLYRYPAARFSELPASIRIPLGIVAFLLLSQVVAYTRRFISNQTTRFVRELRTRLARSASTLAQKDNRPPILLLRSFKDDGIVVENERYWGHRFLGIHDERIRLEEVIAETLYPYGPLVTLSNPVDALPPLGAARENVADSVWQRKIEQYMEQASKIVLIIGVTRSLHWEVNQILSRGFMEKCLFVFPPAYRGFAEKSLLLGNCLPELSSELGLQSDEEEIALLSDALVLVGLRRPESFVIKAHSHGHKAMDYAEALRFGVNVIGF